MGAQMNGRVDMDWINGAHQRDIVSTPNASFDNPQKIYMDQGNNLSGSMRGP
jgi:hypothetical protein